MKVISLAEKKEYKVELDSINEKAWPEFMLNWDCKEWSQLFTTFEKYQILIINNKEELMAYGHTIPIYWDEDIRFIPDNLKILMEMAVKNNQDGIRPNLLLALAVVVSEDYKGKGLSYEVVNAMKIFASKNKIEDVIIPVRPTLKAKYPLISLDDYVGWENKDGKPFDPWLRVHKKLGGKVFKTAEISMIIRGKINEWEKWTNTVICGSGKYIFKDALNPVEIDIEKNEGIYTDPCVWVHYSSKK